MACARAITQVFVLIETTPSYFSPSNFLFFPDFLFFLSHSQPVPLFHSPDSLFFPNFHFFLSLSQHVLLFYTRKSSQPVILFYFSVCSLIFRNSKHPVSQCLATLPSSELSLSEYVGKKLSELIRDSGGLAPGTEQGRWQSELAQVATELIAMKTGCLALVLCLNISVDPPDVIKISPCARMECWTGK
ncbi:uncharacterized protein [Gossypium hirsutum]|uniref:Raptor N-terminal CASPase-like domain-containing protein n=1 Tax=Gossypium hirsutum TaxID=3635 RepID=A0ABM2ZD95_GOSHI|nr:uncharacterized protein LOC107894029 [Gossypium hirsutum]